MKSHWKFIVPLVLFAGLFVLFYVSLDRDKQTLPSPYIGKQAPKFSLPSLSDPAIRVTNADFAGKPYLVNVWATWCAVCIQEHPVLLQIAERKEVPIIGIDWNDDLARAALYLRRKGNPYTFSGFDPEGGSIAIDFGVYAAPETFLVDGNGIVQYKHASELTMEVWEQEFVPRLRRQSQPAVQTRKQ